MTAIHGGHHCGNAAAEQTKGADDTAKFESAFKGGDFNPADLAKGIAALGQMLQNLIQLMNQLQQLQQGGGLGGQVPHCHADVLPNPKPNMPVGDKPGVDAHDCPPKPDNSKEIAETKKELAETKEEKSKLEGEKDKVSQDKTAAQTEKKELQNDQKDLQNEKKELQNEKKEIANEAADVAKDVAESTKNLHELKKELADAKEAAKHCDPEVHGKVEVTEGRIWGDPHFVGADGGKFDVQGEAGKTYNILSDTGIQMNATFKEWNNPGTTVVERVGITTDNNTVEINEKGQVIVDGDIAIPNQDGSYIDGLVEIKNGKVTVNAGEYSVELSQFRSNAKAGDWINNIEIRSDDANSDGKLPSGLWGATVDGDGHARHGDRGKGTQGGGAIENLEGEITQRGDKHTVELYEVDSVLSTDFQNFNEFRDLAGEKVAHLEKKVAEELLNLTGLHQKLDGLEGKLDGVEKKLDVLDSKLQMNEDKLARLDTKIDNLTQKEDAICDKIEKLEGKIETLEKKLDELGGNPDPNAGYGPELIKNGSFDTDQQLNRGSWGTLDQIEGWKSSQGQFEIQQGGHHGGTPAGGADASIVELDAHGHESNGGIQQTVTVEKAGVHELTFDYSPRKGPNDTAESSQMEVVINGKVIDTISSDKVGFETYTYKGDLPAGENVIEFRGAGTEDTYGALLDNVSLKRAPNEAQPPHCQEPTDGGADVNVDVNIDIDVDIYIHGGDTVHNCHPPKEEPEVEGPVEVTQGRIWGDPHFVGADGGKYDVQGEAGKTYNILSDTGIQMNATFKEWNNPGTTVVEQVGFSTDQGQIQVNEDGSMVLKEIVGQTKSIPPQNIYNTTEVGKGEAGSYMDGAVTVNDKGHITVQAGEYEVTFDNFASNAKSGDWINNIEIRSDDANSDGNLPTGLWGATVDGDGQARNGDKGKGTQGGGAIENLEGEITEKGDKDTVKLYEVDNIFDTNFQNFNEFKAEAGVNQGAQNLANWNMPLHLLKDLQFGFDINVDIDFGTSNNDDDRKPAYQG